MKILTTILFLLLCVTPALAQQVTVTFRVTVPETTPPDATIHLVGDFQGWNPGHPQYRLSPVGDRVHEIAVDFDSDQPLQFKFTLGDWARVEKGPQGEELLNRLHVASTSETVESVVASWAAGAPVRASISGNVTRLDVPGFWAERPIWVYLPPGYHDAPDRSFPVLYMLDGQNVFDDATSFVGEWHVDEALETMIPRGEVAPLIVVAVGNDGQRRSHEYTPWANAAWSDATGGGGEHLRAIVHELKPFIDSRYRTLTGPDHTGLAGSSFGGLMGLYAAYVHADVFGCVAALSPTLYWVGEQPRRWIDERDKPAVRLYVDMGTRESGNLQDGDGNGVDDAIDALRRLRVTLENQGFVTGHDLQIVADEGGRHNEEFWTRRFPGAVRFLFPGTGAGPAETPR